MHLDRYFAIAETNFNRSMELIVKEGHGVIVYIQHHEGRGIGILHKLKAYELQQRKGLDTIEANHALGHPIDSRDYGIGAQVLYDLDSESDGF